MKTSCSHYLLLPAILMASLLTGCGGEPIEEPPAEYNTLTECAIGDWLFTEEKGVTYFETNYVFHEDGRVELKKYVDVDEWQLWLNAGDTDNDLEIFPGVNLTLEQIGILLWLSNYTGYFYSEGTYTVDEDAQKIIITYPKTIVGQSRWGYNGAKSDFATETGNAGGDIRMTTDFQTVTCEDNQLMFASFGNSTGNLEDEISGAQIQIKVNPETMVGRFHDSLEPIYSQSIKYYQLAPVEGGYDLYRCSDPSETTRKPITIDTVTGPAFFSDGTPPTFAPEFNEDNEYSYFTSGGFLKRRSAATGDIVEIDTALAKVNGEYAYTDYIVQYAHTEIPADSGVYETTLRITYKDGSDSKEVTIPHRLRPTSISGQIALTEWYTSTEEDKFYYFDPYTLEYRHIVPGRKGDYDGFDEYSVVYRGDLARITYRFNPEDTPPFDVRTLMDLSTGEERDYLPSGNDTFLTDVYRNGQLLYVSTNNDGPSNTLTINIEARTFYQPPQQLLSVTLPYNVSSSTVKDSSYNAASGNLYLEKYPADPGSFVINLDTFEVSSVPLYPYLNMQDWLVATNTLYVPYSWALGQFPDDAEFYVLSPDGESILIPAHGTGAKIWRSTFFSWNARTINSFSPETQTLKEYENPAPVGTPTSGHWPPALINNGDYQVRPDEYYLNVATDQFEKFEYPDQSFINEIDNLVARDDNLFSAELVSYEQSCSTASSGILRQEGPAFWIEWNDGTTSRGLTTFTRQ